MFLFTFFTLKGLTLSLFWFKMVAYFCEGYARPTITPYLTSYGSLNRVYTHLTKVYLLPCRWVDLLGASSSDDTTGGRGSIPSAQEISSIPLLASFKLEKAWSRDITQHPFFSSLIWKWNCIVFLVSHTHIGKSFWKQSPCLHLSYHGG